MYFSDLDENPEYIQVMSDAAQNVQRRKSSGSDRVQRRSSSGSDRGSQGSKIGTQANKSQKHTICEDTEEEFLNKVCKFELISRGKTSSSSKSPTSKHFQSNESYFPSGKSSSSTLPTSPSCRTYTGDVGNHRNNTSYTADNKLDKQKMNPGTNYSPYTGEKVFSRETATTRVSADLLRGGNHNNTARGGNNTAVNTERVTSSGSTSSGGSFTSVSSVSGATLSWHSDSSKSAESVSSSKTLQTASPKTPISPADSLKRKQNYVTLKPKPPTSTEILAERIMNGDLTEAFTHVDSKQSTHKHVDYRPQRNHPKDYGSESNRNTFDGMDFDFSELTSSQQDLSIKHQEMVAERKKEQEMEKVEKLRLEEILSMCAEYERQIEEEKSPQISPISKVSKAFVEYEEE